MPLSTCLSFIYLSLPRTCILNSLLHIVIQIISNSICSKISFILAAPNYRFFDGGISCFNCFKWKPPSVNSSVIYPSTLSLTHTVFLNHLFSARHYSGHWVMAGKKEVSAFPLTAFGGLGGQIMHSRSPGTDEYNWDGGSGEKLRDCSFTVAPTFPPSSLLLLLMPFSGPGGPEFCMTFNTIFPLPYPSPTQLANWSS